MDLVVVADCMRACLTCDGEMKVYLMHTCLTCSWGHFKGEKVLLEHEWVERVKTFTWERFSHVWACLFSSLGAVQQNQVCQLPARDPCVGAQCDRNQSRLCCCCAKQEDTQRDGKRRSGSHRQSFSMWTYLCISCAKVNSCWWEFHNLLLKFRSERWQNEGKSGNICFFTGIYLPKKKEMITILSEILQSNVHTEDSKADAMCCSYEGWSWYNSVLRGP